LEVVYGDPPEPDDPAEAYHEASKLTPSQLARQMKGARRLEASSELRLGSTRAVRRHGGARIPIPAGTPLTSALGDVIARRRSRRDFGCEPVAADALAALLNAGYGVTGALQLPEDHPPVSVRAVPSGGALYPLELYAAALRVDGIEPGLYHFDPLFPCLEVVRPSLTEEEIAALSTYPAVASSCAVLLLIAGIFGRSRFKYALRGYRFALLEAGHVAQNIVLAAAALRLAAVPLGAFYDRRADAFLGLDGVNESTLYTIAVGQERL
jgi:SagB-type dehydrogenase family enzyme